MNTLCRGARALLGLGILLAACAGDGPVDPSTPVGPGTITIHGIVRSWTDSSSIAGALLEVVEITPANTPDIHLATTTTSTYGTYRVTFAAECDREYGISANYPIIACSRCPIRPLPVEACLEGDWTLDVWVQN